MTTPPRSLSDDDRYELGPALGRGGMADVVRAHDRLLDRDVAVKLLRKVDPADRARFETEARLLALLNHPNIVTVLDAGVDGASPWLMLELVEGATLDVLLADGPVDGARLAPIGGQLAAALAHAHSHGVVHRDVKPSNVLVAAGDRVKLTDFGIARLAGSEASLTLTGQTIGTAAYLAPEQVTGDAIGAPADVYSLGLVLLEALTGRREYEGAAVEAAMARLQRSPLIPTSLPTGWAGLISTMTARQPADRPTAAAVAGRLRALAGRPAGAAPVQDPSTTTASLPVLADTRRRRRTPMVVGLAVVAGLVLAAALRLAGGAGDAPASAGSMPSGVATGGSAPTASPRGTPSASPSATPRAVKAGTGSATTAGHASPAKRPKAHRKPGHTKHKHTKPKHAKHKHHHKKHR